MARNLDVTALSGTDSGSLRPWVVGGSVEGLTLPQLLAMRAEAEAAAPAVRAIERGALVTYTWTRQQEAATMLAGAFAALGLERGARAVLVGPARWPLVVAEHAVWRAGGVTAALSHHLDPDEFASLVNVIDPSLVVVDLLGISSNLRLQLPRIVGQTSAVAVTVDTAPAAKPPPGFLALADLDASVPAPDLPSDAAATAAIVFTSGRIRPPRPIVHSHASLLAAALAARTALPALPPRATLVCAIPSAHYLGKLAMLTLPLVSHVVPHLPERPDLELEAIRRLAPHVVLEPPRFFEKLAARVEGGLDRSGPLRKPIVARARTDGGYASRAFWGRLARLVIFRQLLRRLGLHRVRIALTGGASIDDRVVRAWRRWGLELRRFYSIAELGGPAAFESRTSSVFESALGGASVSLAVDSRSRLLLTGSIPSSGTWSGGTVEPWSTKPLDTGDLASMTGNGLQLLGRADQAGARLETGVDGAKLAAQLEELETVDKALIHLKAGVPAAVVLLVTAGGSNAAPIATARSSSSAEGGPAYRTASVRDAADALLKRARAGSPEVVVLERPLDLARGERTLLGEPRLTVVLDHMRSPSVHDVAVEGAKGGESVDNTRMNRG